MLDPAVRSLLDVVRRRLWHDEGRRAIRRAAWLSAGSMLLAGTVHLLLLAVPVSALLVVIGLEWIAMLAWVAWRRPSDTACALWIDRRLGGASAFSTLLDATSPSSKPSNAQALRWLEQWVTAQVADVLRSLGEQRPAARVAGALLSMVVCSALALFVMALPDTAPATRHEAISAAIVPPNPTATPASEAPVAARLASELSSALRSTETPGEQQRKGAGEGSATGTERPDDARASSSTTGSPPSDPSTPRDTRSAASVDASTATATGQGRSAAAPSGHDAGDSPDSRPEAGVSRPATGTIGATRFRSTVVPGDGGRRADMEQAAGFDEGASTSGSSKPGTTVAVAAATPPPAVETARLSPTETTYVQAWMKATGRNR